MDKQKDSRSRLPILSVAVVLIVVLGGLLFVISHNKREKSIIVASSTSTVTFEPSQTIVSTTTLTPTVTYPATVTTIIHNPTPTVPPAPALPTATTRPATSTPLPFPSFTPIPPSATPVITQYPVITGPPTGAGTKNLTPGPNNTIWFSSFNGVSRMSAYDASIKEFTLSMTVLQPAWGPDNALWFLESSSATGLNGGVQLGRMTYDGVLTTYNLTPITSMTFTGGENGVATAMAIGPDGNLWLACAGHIIARVTLQGIITLYQIPQTTQQLTDIIVGPDNAMWFSMANSGGIGRIALDGSIKLFNTAAGGNVTHLIVGSDKALWFIAELSDKIGRIDVSGNVSYYPLKFTSSFVGNQVPFGIAAGPDGQIWYTDYEGNAIGRFNPQDKLAQEYALPDFYSEPYSITQGPDGAMWFSESNNPSRLSIGRITP